MLQWYNIIISTKYPKVPQIDGPTTLWPRRFTDQNPLIRLVKSLDRPVRICEIRQRRFPVCGNKSWGVPPLQTESPGLQELRAHCRPPGSGVPEPPAPAGLGRPPDGSSASHRWWSVQSRWPAGSSGNWELFCAAVRPRAADGARYRPAPVHHTCWWFDSRRVWTLVWSTSWPDHPWLSGPSSLADVDSGQCN